MSDKNLNFFNKQGDSLNFRYDDINEIYQGDILFDENSTDTFKTFALYTLEKIPAFDFESGTEMGTNKFQLFNEFGIHFYDSKDTLPKKIIKIEPVNNDPAFYSKWIYGDNFEKLFPLGSIIKFVNSILEFTNSNQTFSVIGSKKDAIMIISSVDNSTFESNYSSIYSDLTYFVDKNIIGVNSIGVYNYINSNYENNISIWSEPNFYDKLYIGKKLNIINSNLNNNIYTVSNPDITDIIHYEYLLNILDVPIDTIDVIIEVILGTDLPNIYNGNINIVSNRIYIDPFNYPFIRPGQEFKIIGSLLNQNFQIASNISDFNLNNKTIFYNIDDQVLFNGKVYQCIQSYTHSNGSDNTRYIDPTNVIYWSNPTYISVDNSLVNEELLFGQISLTKEKFYYSFGWTGSSAITLAMMGDRFKEDLKLFNIDLYYKDGYLKSDLIYPTKYASVNYYINSVNESNLVVDIYKTNERLIEVNENLVREFNYDISENFKYSIVFTDIDEYGFKVLINKQVYDIEVSYVYSGNNIDMLRTIDRTLRSWLSKYYLTLFKLGINVELQFIGNYTSVFYNSILIISEYPNVPIDINSILVGSTANYYIEHSSVLFYKMGPILDININNKSYLIQNFNTGVSGEYSVPIALKNWIDQYSEDLLDIGIIVTNFNNLLKFDIKGLDRRLDYIIKTGNLSLPGLLDYKITNKIKGNLGVVIASNEVILSLTSSNSFEAAGFATGMVTSINNTFYTWVNQEFNIEYLDPYIINLSYQGPFWNINNVYCNKSPFVTIAFDNGFGSTGCGPLVIPSDGGEFDLLEFNLNEFNVIKYPNTYDIQTYDGISDMVDIKYIQISNTILVLGDNVAILDSYFGNYIGTIDLLGNTQSIKMEYNTFNNYVYCLSINSIWIIDPLINLLITNIPLSNNANDLIINSNNGDVYVSYNNSNSIDIFKSTSFSFVPDFTIGLSASSSGKMIFNTNEGDIYITTDSDLLYRVNGNTRLISNNYSIIGLTNSFIFYEPDNSSVFVSSNTNLWIIDNNIATITTYPSQSFIDMVYNNLNGEIEISDNSNNFTRLNIDGNIIRQSNIANYGYLALNPYDGGVYISSQYTNSILVVDSITTDLVFLKSIGAPTTKIVYNPDKKSIWSIQPSINKIIEIEVTINTSISENQVQSNNIADNMYGTLDPNYLVRDNMWLKSRDYYRRPRQNFEGDVKVNYYFKWLSDNVNEFFLYDFSGDQLENNGSYSYIGEKPLSNVILNIEPNKDITKISDPLFQQTIFNKVSYELSYIDDKNDISNISEPLQTFIGFRSNDEGALRSILQLYKSEDINFTISGNSITKITLDTINDIDKRGIITIDNFSMETFIGRGLKPNQHIIIYLKDNNNSRNQYISNNNGTIVKIREVYNKTLIVDFIDINNDILELESTTINNYPKTNDITYLDFSIKVKDKEIGRFFTYGQTEEEDIRYKVELGNVGKLVDPNDIFIFKQYDIEEGGIDWLYLNKKRKEMLMMKHLIYPYIGSYKSIINAINFFGYNDLQLNEYYRNVDITSPNFSKLFKVEIPDIFDNTVEGWNDNDFIKNTMPNDKFEDTNMFNLSYLITDKEGNNILNYSVDEIIIKLQGLKYWLKKNIIPLTHKILDITGNTYFTGGIQITHKVNDVNILNINDNMTPVSFKLNEAYLMPVNSGSTVYNCVLDFYSIIPNIGADKSKNGLIEPPKPFNGKIINMPEYFNIKIRTYKTYKEWTPFITYFIGDKVTYYGKIYESIENDNKINNPRKYEDVSPWILGNTYNITNIVKYNRNIYVYRGIENNVSINTPATSNDWLLLNKWVEIDLEPVQTIKEFRIGSNMLPFNFTIDSNIDPFLVIEVTSDNGYGCIYTDRKNYEIRGIKDLVEVYSPIETIGPFKPISFI